MLIVMVDENQKIRKVGYGIPALIVMVTAPFLGQLDTNKVFLKLKLKPMLKIIRQLIKEITCSHRYFPLKKEVFKRDQYSYNPAISNYNYIGEKVDGTIEIDKCIKCGDIKFTTINETE